MQIHNEKRRNWQRGNNTLRQARRNSHVIDLTGTDDAVGDFLAGCVPSLIHIRGEFVTLGFTTISVVKEIMAIRAF